MAKKIGVLTSGGDAPGMNAAQSSMQSWSCKGYGSRRYPQRI